jgi:ferredoxin
MTVLAATKTKPLYGDPCNGCGLCCIASQCPVSLIIFGQRDLCPALISNQLGGYVCGLVSTGALNPAAREAAAFVIGSGTGCDFTATDADRAIHDEKWAPMRDKAIAAMADLSPEARRQFDRWRSHA